VAPTGGGRCASTMASMLIAHQGGWDEILFALIPLLVVGLLLLLANKRANAARRSNEELAGRTPAGPPSADHPSGS
jgi:hypothetical protein